MKKINRREFIKIGSIGVSALSLQTAFGGIIPLENARGRNVSIFTSKFRQGIPSICDLCPAHCGVIGFLRYDHIVAIQGNPAHPNNLGKLCARGIAGVNQVYDPDRILFPQKRVGKRGENNWQRISWEEALTEIAQRLRTIKNNRLEKEFVFQADGYHLRGLARKFVQSLAHPNLLIDSDHNETNKANASRKVLGVEKTIADVRHSKFVLNFGANLFESFPDFVPFNQRFSEGRIQNNLKLITLDPRMSNTAGRSDKWLPLFPGTDGVVALAMANVILSNNLFDEQFITRWTDVSVAELRTAFRQYTPELAGKISGLEPEEIENLAIEFAQNQPGVALTGGGATSHLNGYETERAVLLLNALVGNFNKKGGLCLPNNFQLADFSETNFATARQGAAQFFQDLNQGKEKVSFYFAYKSNPVYEYPDCDLTQAVFKDERLMPFIVVMDTVKSETAALADIVLPAATFVESWNLDVTPGYDHLPFVALAQPVIKPQGEALSLDDFCLQLSKKIGLSAAVLAYENTEQYYSETVKQLSFISDSAKLRKQGIWSVAQEKAANEKSLQPGFKTRSGKMELAGSAAAGRNLPQFVQIEAMKTLSRDELILIPYKVHVMRADLTNLKWLAEIHHSNFALLNRKTARSLQIVEGDYIMLESKVGKLIIKVHLTEGVHPNVVAISEGLGHWEYGRFAQSKKFSSDDPDSSFLWWEKAGKGTHPNFIIPVALDPSGKGQAWKDTKVKISKV